MIDDKVYSKSNSVIYAPYSGMQSFLDSDNLDNADFNLYGQYRTRIAELGMTTDPRTAFQIKEVSDKLSTGIKTIEVSAISPEIFESIPEQHLKEMNRLSKLTGVDITVHGPLVEPSGITREGWNEMNREAAERQMSLAAERSGKMTKKGVVTFHSSAAIPETEERVKVGKEEKIKSMLVIDPQTGAIRQLRERERYFPGEPREFVPEEELKKQNEETWRNILTHTTFNLDRASHYIKEAWPILVEDYEKIRRKEIPEERLSEQQKVALGTLRTGDIFLKDSYRELRELFSMAYKSALEQRKSEDKSVREAAITDLENLNHYRERLENQMKGLTPEEFERNVPKVLSAVDEGIKTLGELKTPRIFQPLKEFVIDKSSETFANVALNSYKKLKDKAPVISIENPPAGAGLSRAEDLRELIKKSRERFIEKATSQGYSKSEAKRIADRMIGATWDVGHINMLRKYGYSKEEILKETGKIAPFVKHVHLSDNFGFEHTELPMGMGNVPFKEIFKRLGKEGFEGKKIIEAAQWWQHFKTAPLPETASALGSPIYAMNMAPYWNQIWGRQGNYSAGYGTILPEQHFSLYGAGFSSLPTELGGQIPGKGSRFGGVPME